QRFKSQPDWLQIWPGHGAGSACGKGLSAIPHSTVGYERRFNWAFAAEDEDQFVRLVLAGQPEPPAYFGLMKRVNKAGPAALGGLPRPEELPPERLAALVEAGGIVIDLRPAAEFAAAHIPGTLNFPHNRAFTSWVGSLLPYERDIHLLTGAGGGRSALHAARDLALIGMDTVRGWFPAEALDRWREAGRPLGRTRNVTAREAARLARDGAAVVDVRSRAEWDAGHVPGATHLPLGSLPRRLDELPPGQPLVLLCQGGGRSAIAASLLTARGAREVVNLPGGFTEWSAEGLPVERGDTSPIADLVVGPDVRRG
ncbi:MAG TPA: rhodanese-like domain-containing protein, partial [Gemmatimonadales bacterium]|nr:rhodanese-like domain-containing protein [Gemmatimonadales bacterium]